MQKLNWNQFWLREGSYWSWVESVVITLAVLEVCTIINPSNPFYINTLFPWPWIAGILIALQYGFARAILSILIVALAISYHYSASALSNPPYQTYLLTGTFLVFLCSFYSSSWLRRIARAEELSDYTEQRLDILSRSYNVLRVSYDYLEQSLISKPVTLREIEKKLQQSLVESNGEINPKNALQFLEITTQYCSLREAAIYLCHNKNFVLEPIASIGERKKLNTDDPLFQYLTENNEESYVTLKDMVDPKNTGYVAVVPLITSKKELIGVLTIKEMSFWRLNHETLQVLQILGLYFSQEYEAVKNTKELLKLFPTCPPEFLKEMDKLLHLKQSLDIDSAISIIAINASTQTDNIVHLIKKQQRGFDYVWHFKTEEQEFIFVLMPFTNAVGLNGYLSRLNKHLSVSHGKNLAELGISERSTLLYGEKPEVFLSQLLMNATGSAI